MRSSIKATYRVTDEDDLPIVDGDFADVRSANRAAMATGVAEYDIDEYHDGRYFRMVARARATEDEAPQDTPSLEDRGLQLGSYGS